MKPGVPKPGHPACGTTTPPAGVPAGTAGDIRAADAVQLPFGVDDFGAAWAFESLLHMDRPKALSELTGVVRPEAAAGLAGCCGGE
ncbi:methyltransferase domain-containing protein [Lentzea sp. NPDC004789]